MKLYDEEGVLLLQLITCRPPPTEAGLRFVALGLCMLMACPSLIALPDQEQRGFQWVGCNHISTTLAFSLFVTFATISGEMVSKRRSVFRKVARVFLRKGYGNGPKYFRRNVVAYGHPFS